MKNININGLEFIPIASGSSWLGSDKGGWIYASQRPRYEVRLPTFYILKKPLTRRQIATLLDEEMDLELPDDPMTGLTIPEIETLQEKIAIGLDSMELEDSFDVRLPSFPEWNHAFSNIELKPGIVEILSDAAATSHRGGMMDGRPRPIETDGPLQYHRLAVEMHPRKTESFATSNIPVDRTLPNTVIRFVLSPPRDEPIRRVPESADLIGNLKTEIFWTTVLGIIPSFLIPIIRGFGSYAIDGWVNLLFGGLVAGFVTGAIWRPRRPSISYEEGIQESDGLLANVSQ
ncbi:MAG: hypothetical protein VXY42_03945 [Candidatus Thermoplasmatota archaeon]|nr:hypothetical protein [Candidatus Thermoplasmatota archaeon]MEC8609639.1 hypothetical protein [Candidatus Thermoplasmatota archaeon]